MRSDPTHDWDRFSRAQDRAEDEALAADPLDPETIHAETIHAEDDPGLDEWRERYRADILATVHALIRDGRTNAGPAELVRIAGAIVLEVDRHALTAAELVRNADKILSDAGEAPQ